MGGRNPGRASTGLRRFCAAGLATARRAAWVDLRAYRWSFLAAEGSTAVYGIALAYLLHRVVFSRTLAASFVSHTGSDDYLSFVAVGIFLYVVVSRTLLNVGRSLITERREGTLEALLLTPASRLAYLLGTMTEQMVTTGMEAGGVLLVALLFGADLSRADPGAAAACLAVSLVGFFGMSILLGAVMLYLRETFVTQNTFLNLVYFLCGVLFPVEYLPAALQGLAGFLPVTLSLKLLRSALILGTGLADLRGGLARLAALSAVYCVAGLAALRRVERVALEEMLA